MEVSILVASAQNNVIGKANALPFRLQDDLQNFKRLTIGHTVLMGRNTYQSIGKPLPNRKNIVLSRQDLYAPKGLQVFCDLDLAIQNAKLEGETELFVIGGAVVYEQVCQYATRLYWTRVQASVSGDTFFTPPDLQEWILKNKEAFQANVRNEHSFEIEFWERK